MTVVDRLQESADLTLEHRTMSIMKTDASQPGPALVHAVLTMDVRGQYI
jgi:hypothetical protein